MTAVPASPETSELRELFRYLLEFRSIFAETGVEEISTPLGNRWSIWDLEYLYKQCGRLSLRQRQAITLCLVHNMREKDAARAMGVKETNPVMMYATQGLTHLLTMVKNGELDRFRHQRLNGEDRYQRQVQALYRLADEIKSKVHITPRHDCWLYPSARARSATMIQIPSVYHSSRYALVNPMVVMYQAYVGPLPRYFELVHPPYGRSPLACVNYRHAVLVMNDEVKQRQEKLLGLYQRKIDEATQRQKARLKSHQQQVLTEWRVS